LGFFFPGLSTNTVSEKAEWKPVDEKSLILVTDDNEMDATKQMVNPILLFDTDGNHQLQNPADLSIQQNLANTFATEVFEMINVADIDRRLKETDPRPDDENDNPIYDIVGENRDWTNWVIPTFTPTGTISAGGGSGEMEKFTGAPRLIRGASSQVNSETNNFTGKSSKYNNLLSQYSSSGRKYEDPDFPATLDSIMGFGEGASRADYDTLVWYRPEVFFDGKPYTVFDEDIDPNDIEQGALGDCYLLATLSSISEYPDRIKRIFTSKATNKPGIYCMAMCITGMWEDIIIDDQFPCTAYSKDPAFNSSKSDELWVMIAEKAWAKVHGGYHNIEGGLIRETLHDLTGAPAITFFVSEGTPEDHWKNLREADAKEYIMACGSDDINQTGNDNLDKTIGLAGNHAYSLIGVYEIDAGSRRVLGPNEPSSPANDKILKLRNPWGQGEWKGEWSDNSSKWTPQLKTSLGFSKGDDGIFFMNFKDWQKYFYDYQVCYYNDNFKYSCQKFNSSPSEPTHISFRLDQGGEYYFTVNQVNKRMFRKTDLYAYSQLTLFIARQEGDSFKYVGSVSKADKEMWFKAQCQPGKYIAYVMTPWKRKVNEFSFSVYGLDETEIELVDKTAVPTTFLECVMIEKAKKDKGTLRNYAAQGEPDIFYKFENGSDSIGYFYFNNKSKQSQLTATIDCVDMIDTEFLAPYSGRKPQVIVCPGEEKIVLYKMKGANAKLNFRMMASFKKQVADLGQQAKAKGVKLDRTDQFGNSTGIALYVLYHESGVIAFYENNSTNLTLVEDVKFDLRGCRIEGMTTNSVQSRVAPGKTALINIVKSGDYGFSCNVVYCTYEILRSWN